MQCIANTLASHQQTVTGCVYLQTFVSRTRLAVQRAEDMTATPFEEDNISVVPSDQGQAPGQPSYPKHHLVSSFVCWTKVQQ